MTDGAKADFGDLPVGFAVNAAQRLHTADGQGFYVRQRGDAERGLVTLYFEDVETLLIQERDFERDILVWREKPLPKEQASEQLTRMSERDPDLWIIEIDGSLEKNPFVRLG
ncbi:MAG: DUF1491 family protein [Alphaproteobacteria bacterium]